MSGIDLSKITPALIAACSRIDDVDAAFKIMQDAAGIVDGGLADTIVDRDAWTDHSFDEREADIGCWIAAERLHDDTPPADETARDNLIDEAMRRADFFPHNTGGNCMAWRKGISTGAADPKSETELLVIYGAPGDQALYGPLESAAWGIGEYLDGDETKSVDGLTFAQMIQRVDGWVITADSYVKAEMFKAGYQEFSTGGGMKAWAKFLDGDQGDHYILVTYEEGEMFGPLADPQWMVGEYREADSIKFVGGKTFPEALALAKNWTPEPEPTSYAALVAGLREIKTMCEDERAISAAERADELAAAAVDSLARAFIWALTEDLSAAQLKAVDALNAAETDPLICHSHDFCDSNMSMGRAFERICGRESDAGNQADADLWNAAWNRAMEIGFAPKAGA